MVLVLVCCIVWVVPINKVHFFIWKLVVKAGLLCSLVGIGKIRGWDEMGRGGICSPFSISAAVAVHEGKDRAMR